MRIIKLIIISSVILFGVLMVMSLFIPSHVRISRAININAPVENIKDQIQDIRHWRKWNEMLEDGGTFQATSFHSKNLQVTKLAMDTNSIDTRWKQNNREDIHSAIKIVETRDGTSIVQWYFDFQQKWYPWEKFGSILFDKQIGPSMEKSLDNLKKLLENSP